MSAVPQTPPAITARGGLRRNNIGSNELMLLAVAAIWGSSYALAKQATQQMPVLQFLALRFGLTFLVLLPALRPLFRRDWQRSLQVGGLLGANLLAVFLCETFGVSLTSATNAAFLISLCVAFTPWMEWWLLKQRPPSHMFWAAGASVLGAAMLSSTTVSSLHGGWGDALMLAAALLRALMVCLTKKLAGQHALPALTLTAVQAGVMAAGATLISLALPQRAWSALPASPVFWLSLAFLVLFCTVFAFFAQNHAASHTSPTRVSLLMGCEPVFGALFAMAWLGEQISWLGWAGGLLIVAATWWVTVPRKA